MPIEPLRTESARFLHARRQRVREGDVAAAGHRGDGDHHAVARVGVLGTPTRSNDEPRTGARVRHRCPREPRLRRRGGRRCGRRRRREDRWRLPRCARWAWQTARLRARRVQPGVAGVQVLWRGRDGSCHDDGRCRLDILQASVRSRPGALTPILIMGLTSRLLVQRQSRPPCARWRQRGRARCRFLHRHPWFSSVFSPPPCTRPVAWDRCRGPTTRPSRGTTRRPAQALRAAEAWRPPGPAGPGLWPPGSCGGRQG